MTQTALDPVYEILPGRLWQSGSRVPDTTMLRFDAIVTVGGELQGWIETWMAAGWRAVTRESFRLPLILHAPLIDATGFLERSTAATTARFTAALIRDDRRVLVHCDAGIFRSVFLAALVVAEINGTDGMTALRTVERARGRDGKRVGIGIRDFDEMLKDWGRR